MVVGNILVVKPNFIFSLFPEGEKVLVVQNNSTESDDKTGEVEDSSFKYTLGASMALYAAVVAALGKTSFLPIINFPFIYIFLSRKH